MEQEKHYVCDGRDLVKSSGEQYERYNDGSHRGKKKLEGTEKSEAEKRQAEVRTKAGERLRRKRSPALVRRLT